MKKIEQMADEWLSPKFISEFEGYDASEQEIWIAGFKACREMAAELQRLTCEKWCGTRPCNCAPDEIEKLGEEEVFKNQTPSKTSTKP